MRDYERRVSATLDRLGRGSFRLEVDESAPSHMISHRAIRDIMLPILRDVNPKKASRAQKTVTALKAEGIYSLLSIYFPLWMTPPATHAWLKGYDGKNITLPR
jgi:hypothetical protein